MPLLGTRIIQKWMPRYHSSMALRPVHRIKHVIDAEGNVTGTTNSVIDLIVSVDDPSRTSITECATGSKVNGIYLKVEALHASGAGTPNLYMSVFKNPAGALATASMDITQMGLNSLKKYSIHQEMIMGSGDAGNGLPRVVFNGVIKIPKGYIRNGPNDKLVVILRVGTAAVNFNFCLQAHYKEFQ